ALLTQSIVVNRLKAQAKPSFPVIEKGVCPFECCQFGRWVSPSPLRAFRTEGDTAHLAFTIASGDTFRAVTGNVHIDKPGVVVVTKPILAFAPGDTVYTLGYTGEGSIDVWSRGEIANVEKFWEGDGNFNPAIVDTSSQRWKRYSGVLVVRPIMIWWVQVQRSDGQTGWLRLVNTTSNGFGFDERIYGMDACG
ncbi:MAG TPA: hypothetical protein VEO56_12515, partial [Bacteroidota bacterium]|nr:hypothetical protein [Bacteroidota bacterium]